MELHGRLLLTTAAATTVVLIGVWHARRRRRKRDDSELRVAEVSTPPSAEAFFAEFVRRNVPLVVRGAARGWPAMRWSAEYFESFCDELVTVAPLQVDGPHAYWDKWLEPAAAWEHEEADPEVVDAEQLLVVSASRVKLRMRKFLKLLRPDSHVAATFYADGAGNLAHSFPFLKDDFSPPPFAAALELKRTDLWIGGRSISRMHFDNLDNVFAQVVGSKTFVLAPPDAGAALQGGRRLRKAANAYTQPDGFAREGGGVLHETVLNYLCVERPASLPTVRVTLQPGDMLYLPFGWWHEVHGEPDARSGLCASVSHFYHPFFCRLGGKRNTRLGRMVLSPRYDDEDGRVDT